MSIFRTAIIPALLLTACATPSIPDIKLPSNKADIPHDSPDSMFNKQFHSMYGSAPMYNTKADHYELALKAGCTDKYFYSLNLDPVMIDCFTGKHENNKPSWIE